MSIASQPVFKISEIKQDEPVLPAPGEAAASFGRMMLPAGQMLTLQANIAATLALAMPELMKAQTEIPAAHNVKLLPMVALLPHNGLAIGGAILQAIRTLKSESDRHSKERSEEKQKKKKKSLRGLIKALMQSAKEQEQEKSDSEEQKPLAKRKAARSSAKSRFSPQL